MWVGEKTSVTPKLTLQLESSPRGTPSIMKPLSSDAPKSVCTGMLVMASLPGPVIVSVPVRSKLLLPGNVSSSEVNTIVTSPSPPPNSGGMELSHVPDQVPRKPDEGETRSETMTSISTEPDSVGVPLSNTVMIKLSVPTNPLLGRYVTMPLMLMLVTIPLSGGVVSSKRCTWPASGSFTLI